MTQSMVTTFSPKLIQGIKTALPNVIAHSSKGSYVFTECGRKYIDFSCGIGVTNLGHCHPGVTAAAQKAVGTLVHAQQNIMKHRPMMDLIQNLAHIPFCRDSGLDAWYFWNSGAEAVEASVKLARQATGRPNIVAFNLGYHGRTYGAMALTTSGTIYRAGFGPLMSGNIIAPFPYITQGPYAVDGAAKAWPKHSNTVDGFAYWGAAPDKIAEMDTDRCISQLELILKTQSAPSETAAFLIEPVQGEGGYIPCPPGFLSKLRELCDRHDILLIADEVQTGFGRTGKMFACEWLDGGVRPDILIMAKGLGNGFPISAIASRYELTAKQPPGSMGGTYGGNAVSCAAALAVLEAFKTENVLQNAQEKEIELRTLLASKVTNKFPGLVREVRGKGLMVGVEFNPLPGFSVGETAYKITAACHRRGLLILNCGPYDTMRFIPPLNISSQELKEGMDIFEDSVKEVVA